LEHAGQARLEFAMLKQEKEVPLIVGMMALEAFQSFSLLLYSPSALSVYINQPKVQGGAKYPPYFQ